MKTKTANKGYELPYPEEFRLHKPFCLECGKEMVYGRPDRKFCCPSCKNRYHNRSESASKRIKLRVQHILEKNYRILLTFLESGIRDVPLSSLTVMGFNPLYFTSSVKQKKCSICMCFDIIYHLTARNVYNMEFVNTLPK
ncbi:MAG: hypothetical protein IJ151_03300 [Bacteroidales bacterium]|nr:hypothetical protein [Bacteroidales bacterium]